MTLFKSETHQDIWIEHHCRRCWHGRGLGDPTQAQCPILVKALGRDRKPVEWERNTRSGALMSETMKCHNETRTAPALLARRVVDEDVPMFDVETPTTAMDSEHQ